MAVRTAYAPAFAYHLANLDDVLQRDGPVPRLTPEKQHLQRLVIAGTQVAEIGFHVYELKIRL